MKKNWQGIYEDIDFFNMSLLYYYNKIKIKLSMMYSTPI